MKIKLPKMRLPMSTRIGHCHTSIRDYDRADEKMDISQRLSEENEDGEDSPLTDGDLIVRV